MLKMVDGTGIIGVDMVCPLGGAVSPPQPPNYDNVEMEGVGSLMLSNSLKAPLERVELLGNSVQGENPAPDNPQEIKSVGRKSKNLFNIADLRVGQVQKDGTINEKSTYSRTAILDVPEDGKYRIAFNSNDDYTMLYFAEMYTNGVYSQPYVRVHAGNSNSLISLKKGKNILSFSTYNNNTQVDFPKDHNIMIAAESETLGYEPYGYLLDVKVTGENLFDLKKIKKGFVTSTGNGFDIMESSVHPKSIYLDMVIPLKVGQTLNISGVEQDACRIRVKHDTGNYYLKYTANKDTEIIICFYSGLTDENKKTILIEISDTPTNYEPYTEQSVQIALDEPLRGVGEYKDTITKDGVARRIKRIVFDENTPFKEYNAPVQVKTTSFISGTTIKDATGETGIEVMSDRFKAKDRGFDRYDEECITLFGKSIFVRFNKDKNINTAEALTEWLKQNPLTVDYVLAEPVTEPLPESVQALHSYNGTTHITVDSGEVPCGIKLTYRKEI